MGIAGSLFYNPNENEKETLYKRITPSDQQFDEQQDRWNALADYLIPHLSGHSGYAIRTWLQGSYKFGTQVRPPRKGGECDVDLGVYFEWEGKPEDGRYEPDELKQMVQRCLTEYAHSADDVLEVVSPPKSRCSRIRFKGDFHIDVPAYHLAPSRDARMLATEADGWEDSDPKAIYLWFKDRFDNARRAKARRAIRYMKAWAGLKFPEESRRPASLLLTVLVAEAFDNLSDEDISSDDDALRAVVDQILSRLETSIIVVNPVNSEEVLSDRLSDQDIDGFVEELRRLRDIAHEALESDTLVSAVDKWAETFEHFFPLPDEDELRAKGDSLVPVPITIPDVRVTAVAKQNRRRRWEDTNKLGPIPKDCDIDFQITNPWAVPQGAVIEWMVRNEGDEAEYTNDLGHNAGAGLRAHERSAYRGTHYMDCVIKRYGTVIGLRRIPVTIRGMSMPPRNPPRRPAYVSLRGRR